VNLELTQETAQILERILTSYVSDLRMEIAGTDNYGFRQNLKHEEALLKEMLASFHAPAAPG
jgi:hypothetical protein